MADDYHRCTSEGCPWRVYRALLCLEHGGKGMSPEFRIGPDGVTIWRRGYDGPAVPTLRKAARA
jgi:hypothetical protein